MKRRQGFSLVELVVVIMILGILAAVAAPKLLKTSATATDNSLKQTLAVIRDAIELYAASNGGQLPQDLAVDLETYLRGGVMPICPVGPAVGDNSVKYSVGVITGEAAPTNGWHYSTDTGEFICNFNGPTSSDPLVTYDGL